MSNEPEVKRWIAKRKAGLVKDIINGITTAKEAARIYDLTQKFIQPYTLQQSGMVERLIRTIKERCIWMHNVGWVITIIPDSRCGSNL